MILTDYTFQKVNCQILKSTIIEQSMIKYIIVTKKYKNSADHYILKHFLLEKSLKILIPSLVTIWLKTYLVKNLLLDYIVKK